MPGFPILMAVVWKGLGLYITSLIMKLGGERVAVNPIYFLGPPGLIFLQSVVGMAALAGQ